MNDMKNMAWFGDLGSILSLNHLSFADTNHSYTTEVTTNGLIGDLRFTYKTENHEQAYEAEVVIPAHFEVDLKDGIFVITIDENAILEATCFTCFIPAYLIEQTIKLFVYQFVYTHLHRYLTKKRVTIPEDFKAYFISMIEGSEDVPSIIEVALGGNGKLYRAAMLAKYSKLALAIPEDEDKNSKLLVFFLALKLEIGHVQQNIINFLKSGGKDQEEG